jgi:hypothetical protein
VYSVYSVYKYMKVVFYSATAAITCRGCQGEMLLSRVFHFAANFVLIADDRVACSRIIRIVALAVAIARPPVADQTPS